MRRIETVTAYPTFFWLFIQGTIILVSLKKLLISKRNRDRRIYTIHHSHFDYEKVPKQDELVNLLCIWDYKLKSSSRVIIHATKINSKAFAIPILTASEL